MNDYDHNTADVSAANAHIVDVMSKMPEFEALRRDAVALLAKSRARVYKRGETMIAGNRDDTKNLVILLAGSCEIIKAIDLAGVTVRVGISKVHAPAVFGEIRVFSSRPPIAEVISSQRSLAMVAPGSSIIDLFERSRVPYPRMLRNFARLSVARCKATASAYVNTVDQLFGAGALNTRAICAQVEAVEDMMERRAEERTLDESSFDHISGQLDWLDTILALIRHFCAVEEFLPPDANNMEEAPEYAALTPLAREAAALATGEASVRNAVVKALSARSLDRLAPEEHPRLLREAIRAADELMGFHPPVTESG